MRSENSPCVHTRVIELLWLFSFPKEHAGPFLRPPLTPGFPNGLFSAYSVAFGPSPSCQLRALRASATHLSLSRLFLSRTQSHSATTLVYESITHTSTTGSSHAANGGADHAPTCAYRLVSSPPAHFGRYNMAPLSLYFDIFQWRVESTSHHRLRCILARTLHLPCHTVGFPLFFLRDYCSKPCDVRRLR